MAYSLKTIKIIAYVLIAIGFIRFFKLAMAAFTYDCFDFPVIFSLATHVVFIIINFILLFGVLDRDVSKIERFKYGCVAYLVLLAINIVVVSYRVFKPQGIFFRRKIVFTVWDIIFSVITFVVVLLLYLVEVRQVITKIESDIENENGARNIEEGENGTRNIEEGGK